MDGYPGVAGCGPKTAARLISQYGHLEEFPPNTLGENRENALLFKTLATLRTDSPLFQDVDELLWRGSTPAFEEVAEQLGDARLKARVQNLSVSLP